MTDPDGAAIAAIAEIGLARGRVKSTAFALAWLAGAVALFGLRLVGIRIGALYAVLGAGLLAGGLATAIVTSMTPAIVARVAKRHGLDPDALRTDKYLIK